MKYHLYSIISLSLFLSCSDIKQESTKKNLFVENEIVAVVLMKSNDKTTEEISKATGGFGIPGFKWPL